MNSQQQLYGNTMGYQSIPVPDNRMPNLVMQSPDVIPVQLISDFFSLVKTGNIDEIVGFIRQYNLDITKVVDNDFKHTCLFYAVLIKDKDNALKVMKFFLDRGVAPTYTDILKQTVLFYVAREGKTNCVDMLISLGCSVNHRDQYGQTPLYYASREGQYETVQKLVQLGANVNNEDANGQTALFYAAREGKKEVCELLIKYGINVNKQDKRKQTALHWARKANKSDLVDMLIANGAIPPKESASDKKGKSSKKADKESKKLHIDVDSTKKYVLTRYKDGIWRPLSQPELQEFVQTNRTVTEYLKNPVLLQSLKLPPRDQQGVLCYHWDKAAMKIINHMWKQQGAIHFHQPVDYATMNIPDYPQVVQRPMDFGTIKKKLASGTYNNCKEFVDDMNLVFDNCILYNERDSDYGKLAETLRQEFNKESQVNVLDFYMT